ncbi:MAG: hypothetical protein ACRCRW_12470 [Aeromonadaceae bacterium]
MNSLLLKAMNSFSVTCNKAMLQPNDEDRIKLTLKVLHKNRIPINPAEIEQWLQANNWSQRSVTTIVSWAQTISSGGKLPLGNRNPKLTENEVWAKLNAR